MASPVDMSGKRRYDCLFVTDGNRDNLLFCLKAEEMLQHAGHTCCFIEERDAIPGTHIIGHFVEVVDLSNHIVVVLTRDFQRDEFTLFKGQFSFYTHIQNGTSDHVIFIALGIRRRDIEPRLGLRLHKIIYFEENWVDDMIAWNSLKSVLTGGQESSYTESGSKDDNMKIDDGADNDDVEQMGQRPQSTTSM
ncbi:hypothetical protein SNE40_017470 [Patella caerulea]|uniref:TIR domain-containing protein n=1 Tax=Patella caerulea TaxID=87958 RepID=A0AAN8JF36_PATCE